MRRGCISLGEIKCDICEKVIPAAQRYLADDQEIEPGKSKIVRYCIDCCLKRGLAEYRQEKGERILTIFPEREPEKAPEPAKAPESVETEKKE